MLYELNNVVTADGIGFRARSTPWRLLKGFDFMDIATDEDPLRPRMTYLIRRGKGWVDLVRAIHAVTLFGGRFGDLIKLAQASEFRKS